MLLVSSGFAQSQPLSFPDRYDAQIRESVKRWWGRAPDWRWWKAQLYQESRLDPQAVSPVGATGLAQFMPATWAEMQRRLGLEGVAPTHARHAIDAGAFYMARLRGEWSAPRPFMDRHRLAQASYNAGLGSLLAAQRRCGGVNPYCGIIRCLPDVTGRHSAETITYVERIRKWQRLMSSRRM